MCLLQRAGWQASGEYVRVSFFARVVFCYCYLFIVHHFLNSLYIYYRLWSWHIWSLAPHFLKILLLLFWKPRRLGGAPILKPPWPCHYGSPSGLHGVKQAGQDANDNTPTGSLERNYLVVHIIQHPKASHVEDIPQNSHSLNLSFIIRTPYCIRVQLLSNRYSWILVCRQLLPRIPHSVYCVQAQPIGLYCLPLIYILRNPFYSLSLWVAIPATPAFIAGLCTLNAVRTYLSYSSIIVATCFLSLLTD